MQFPVAPADNSALTDAFASLQSDVSAVYPLGPFTVATLPAPGPSLLYRLATVTDLFGNRSTRVRCEKVSLAGSSDYYYWQPSSSDSAGVVQVGAANVSLDPLTSPTSIQLAGAILAGVGRTISFSTAGGWPGAIREVSAANSFGLGSTLNILGAGLGSGVSLLLGGYKKFTLDYTAAGLSWRQLI